jgi:hypothetical protein
MKSSKHSLQFRKYPLDSHPELAFVADIGRRICAPPASRWTWRQVIRLVLSIVVSALSAAAANTGENPRSPSAPVERSGFTSLTSYDSLQSFLGEINRYPGFHVEQIATTRKGRALNVVRVSDPGQPPGAKRLRILLFAQQHGDEPSGKEALTMLLARCASGELKGLLSAIELFIVPQMNPDGAELRQRRTSDSIDLNRNHVILTSPETRALHELFFKILPEVTLDLHEYGSFSKSWRDSGFIKRGDVQLGMLTNLNSSAALKKYQHENVYPFISRQMAQAGYTFHEYIVGSPAEYIRHSTTEINDGRQSFGILNTLSFIQEGRQWKTITDSLKRRTLSQLTSVEGLLAFCATNADTIGLMVEAERRSLAESAGRTFVLRMEHFPGEEIMQIPVALFPSGKDSTWTVRPYRNVVRPLAVTTIPSQYGIMREATDILEVLERHHVLTRVLDREAIVRATIFAVDSVGTEIVEEDSIPRMFVNEQHADLTMRPGDVIVPTSQWAALQIATILEPVSVWGLAKYPAFARLLREKKYPVFRIQ